MQDAFKNLVAKMREVSELEEMQRQHRARAHQAIMNCIAEGALTMEQAARIEAEIHAIENAEAAAPLLAKAIGFHARRRPSAQEIIKNGWFFELPRAPHQRAA